MTGPADAEGSRFAASIARLCEVFSLDAIYAFGSRADEAGTAARLGRVMDPRATSDVDVGVLPRPGSRLDARARARLTMALETAMSGARVDLIVLPEAPPFLALDIVAGELLAVADRDRVAEYELFVLRRAGDLAPFERERRMRLLGRDVR